MPRERISVSPSDNVVEVTWGADQPDIQVATYCPARRVSATVGVDRDGAPDGTRDTYEDFPFTGWYASLNRRELNSLIRVLRRARDAAFGKDE